MSGIATSTIVVCIYSATLVVLGRLAARREQERDTSDGSGLFRGTGIALMVAAMVLPAARLVGTSGLPDILMLLGTIVAVAAAAMPLLRAAPRPPAPPEPRRRRRSTTIELGNRSQPESRPARTRRPSSAEQVDWPAARWGSRSGLDAFSGHQGDAQLGVPAGSHEAGLTPAPRPADVANETLKQVDSVVDEVTQRLRLNPEDRPDPPR